MGRMQFRNGFGGLIIVLCILAALGPGASIALAHPQRPPYAERWTEGFRLEPGVTYTYALRSGDKYPTGQRFAERGTLNLWVSPGGADEIRFWYTVDGIHKNGVAPNDPHALVGALLLSALVGTDPLATDAVRLIATPFQWVHWADLFLESDFRGGIVWEVYQHPPIRFSANRQGGDTYSGEVTMGRETVLELRLQLTQPLPQRVVSRHGRNAYVAELAAEPPRRVLR